MKYIFEHEPSIPLEEKTFILPDQRIKLFKNLLDNYKVFIPEFKLVYAYLNFNSKVPVDYLVMFTAVTDTSKVLLWDVPHLYTNKTIPAYRYICKNNMHSDFFLYIKESICRMTYSKFREFIPCNLCGLSLESESDKYWKKQENSFKLFSAMVELAIQYTPKTGQAGVTTRPHTKTEMGIEGK